MLVYAKNRSRPLPRLKPKYGRLCSKFVPKNKGLPPVYEEALIRFSGHHSMMNEEYYNSLLSEEERANKLLDSMIGG